MTHSAANLVELCKRGLDVSTFSNEFEGVIQGGVLHLRRLNVVGTMACGESVGDDREVMMLGDTQPWLQGRENAKSVSGQDVMQLLHNGKVCLECLVQPEVVDALRFSD